jgi:hypothetical protein
VIDPGNADDTANDDGSTAAPGEPDDGPYFQQALDVVETACDEFTPPG